MFVVAHSPSGLKTGSGFIVASDRSAVKILTANHVVDNADNIVVILDGDLNEQRVATLLSRDFLRDEALLKILADRRKPLPLAASGLLRTGEAVGIVGYPGRHDLAWSDGVVQALAPGSGLIVGLGQVLAAPDDDDRFFFDAPVQPGDSGAPVFNRRTNEVVGMAEGDAFRGEGFKAWLTGSAVALGAGGFASVLQDAPARNLRPPLFHVGLVAEAADPNDNTVVKSLFNSLVATFQKQSDFVAVDATHGSGVVAPNEFTPYTMCRSAGTHALVSLTIEGHGGDAKITLSLMDCSGTPVYEDVEATDSGANLPRVALENALQRAEHALVGYAGAQRGAW
ncbi:MAG: trypsin-like peptidase domain-containing protein, partial [Candidatus Eremiobacteraeota bacterium]|nr:trypsin-like peptidase domain-containing protein [Candidatus Eremiobacteraeota bacterium]